MAVAYSTSVRDLSGQRFGRLIVTKRSDKKAGGTHAWWWVRCDCGVEKEVVSPSLVRGYSQSCGCSRKAVNPVRDSPAYNVWRGMRRRCYDERSPNYFKYGGKGVKVCERWNSFEHFRDDMGARPVGTTLDRYPNNGGNYEPGNCRWATVDEQNRNRKGNVWVWFRGEWVSINDVAKAISLSRTTVINRIKAGIYETKKDGQPE